MRSLKETFSIYFHGLKAAVAPTLSMPKDRFAFLAAVWHTIFRLAGRLDRLITNWQNGILPKPGKSRPARPRVRGPRAKSTFRLPRGRMWLARCVQGSAFGGSQLRHLLDNDQQLQEFLKAVPQARRLLNPLCHMFGLPPVAAPGVTPIVTPELTSPGPEPDKPSGAPIAAAAPTPQPHPPPPAASQGAEAPLPPRPYFSSA
jgi:hypothetical protein